MLQRLRQIRFARSVFAGDQNRAITLGQPIGVLSGFCHGRSRTEQRGKRVLGCYRAFRPAVLPLDGFDGVIPLHDRCTDIRNVAKFDDHTCRAGAFAADRQNGGRQGEAVDVILFPLAAFPFAVQHLTNMFLKPLPLKKLPKMVSDNIHLGFRAFRAVRGAPQQIADALLTGRVAIFLPELDVFRGAVQNHHLSDGAEIIQRIAVFPYLYRDDPRPDRGMDRHALIHRVQLQLLALAAAHKLIHRLEGRIGIYAHRDDLIPAPEPVLVDPDPPQILHGQFPIVSAEIGADQDHHITCHQTAGRMGFGGMVEQAKLLLRPPVNVGDNTAAVHGKHGMGGGIHDILQNTHCGSSFSSP